MRQTGLRTRKGTTLMSDTIAVPARVDEVPDPRSGRTDREGLSLIIRWRFNGGRIFW